MSGYSQWPLQQGIYSALINDAALTALLPNGANDIYNQPSADTAMPYCLFRMGGAKRIGTKQDDALMVTVITEIYSDKNSDQELNKIAAAVVTALDKAVLTASGYNVIDCRFAQENRNTIDCGRYRRSVQNFFIIIEPV